MYRLTVACFVALTLAAGAWAQAPAPATPPAPPVTTAPAAPAGELPQIPLPPQTGTPLSLDEAVATGLAHNQGVMAARLGINIACDQLLGARAAKGPNVAASVIYTRESNVPSFTTFVPDPANPGQFVLETIPLGRADNVTPALNVTMPLYTGGALTAGVRAARANAQATQSGACRTEEQTAYTIKQDYYAVLLAMERITIARATLAGSEEQLRVARAFLAAGTGTEFDVTRNEAQVADAQHTLTAATNAEALARAALNNAMGVPQDTAFNLTTAFQREKVAATLPELQQTAQRQRPDLTQLLFTQEAQRQLIKVAKAARLPSLGLSWTLSAPATTTTFATGGWTLSLAANQTLFDSGRAHAQILQAQDTLRQLEALTLQLSQGVSLDVKQAYLNINSSEQQISSSAVQLRAAMEAERIAQVRYKAGISTTVEVIDAQTARQQAAVNYSAATFTYSLAVAALNLAIGEPVVAPGTACVCLPPAPAAAPAAPTTTAPATTAPATTAPATTGAPR